MVAKQQDLYQEFSRGAETATPFCCFLCVGSTYFMRETSALANAALQYRKDMPLMPPCVPRFLTMTCRVLPTHTNTDTSKDVF